MSPTMQQADPTLILADALRRAIVAVLGDDYAGADPHIRASQKVEFGDFQANAAMGLAKRVGMNPRELAQQIINELDISAIAEPPDIAGPGFINIRLKSEALGDLLAAMDAPALGVEPDADAHPVVIDLCGVNVAKQMHVGHLRSTIIGDALARTFERLGRTVHRENHLGDWGLPIAMVLYELRKAGTDLDALTLPDLDRAYRDAQLAAAGDVRGLAAALSRHAGPHRIIELEEQNAGAHEAKQAAKAALVKLQQHDAELVADWNKLIDCTMRAVYEVNDLLNVKLGPENNRPESFYRERLGPIVQAIEESVGEIDEGALVVRFDDRERPLIVRKSDGGFLYATTDIAGIRFRVDELGADHIIYVVDARQRDHFRDVFDAVRKLGWDKTADGAAVELHHVPFGSVLGADKKPLKTRSGENVTLKSLLVEAIERGAKEVVQRADDPKAPTHDLSREELRAIGQAVGVGAVKYADLSNDLVRDYVFNLDRMVCFEGATGPYVQYAHARVCSIFRKAGLLGEDVADAGLLIREPTEKQLALLLLRYGGVLHGVAQSLEPHRLCTYLYEVAEAFSSFYQACKVLQAEDEATKLSRLRLCDLTRRVLADGLGVLGIESPRKM